MCRKLTEIRFRDDACWVIIDLNGRSTYTPAVISVGNNLLCTIHHSFLDASPAPPLSVIYAFQSATSSHRILYISYIMKRYAICGETMISAANFRNESLVI